MPFNGSGTYTPPALPVFPPSPGDVISSSYYAQVINDLGTALSLTFLRDGSVNMGGDLNLGGNDLINIATITTSGAITTGGPLSINPAGTNGSLLLYSSGTLKANLHAASSGGLYASDAHTFKNLAEGITYLTLGATVAAISTAATVAGGLTSSGAIRATGTSYTFTNIGPGVELAHDGTTGYVQSIDRTSGTVYKPLLMYGSAIQLLPQGGGVVTIGAQTNQQGILTLGGSALGGVNGQVQLLRASDGNVIGQISCQTTSGNEVRYNNVDSSGYHSFRTSSTEYVRINSAGLVVTGQAFASASVRAGSSGTNGSIQLSPGDATHSGKVEFLNVAGSSTGSIQQFSPGGATVYDNVSGGGHQFTGGGVAVTTLSASSNITAMNLVTGAVVIGALVRAGNTGSIVPTGGSDGDLYFQDTGGATMKVWRNFAGTWKSS